MWLVGLIQPDARSCPPSHTHLCLCIFYYYFFAKPGTYSSNPVTYGPECFPLVLCNEIDKPFSLVC